LAGKAKKHGQKKKERERERERERVDIEIERAMNFLVCKNNLCVCLTRSEKAHVLPCLPASILEAYQRFEHDQHRSN
jgi:hypothetical protein